MRKVRNLVVIGSVIVNSPVHFDHEVSLEAEEVRHEERFRLQVVDEQPVLAVKLQAVKLPITQALPQCPFRGL